MDSRFSSIREMLNREIALATAIVDARHGGSRFYGSRACAHTVDGYLRPKRGVKLERKKNCGIKTKSYGPVTRPVPKRVESATLNALYSLSLRFFPLSLSLFVLISRPLQFSGFSRTREVIGVDLLYHAKGPGQIAENPFSKKIGPVAIYLPS